METYYYVEELPLALEYGMTPEQFWDDDIDLLFAYQRAYVNRTHYQAHVQGLYNHIAFGVVMKNAFKKSGDKAAKYPNEPVVNISSNNNNNKIKDNNGILELNKEENQDILYSAKERFLERKKMNNNGKELSIR